MRDLNFFESYIEKREFKLDKKLIYFSLLSLFFLSLIVYTVYYLIIISKETKIVNTLKLTVEDPNILKKVEEIKEKEIEVNEFKMSVDKIKILDKIIQERDKIDEVLLNKINDNIPEDLFLTSLSIQDEEIYIVGISRDKWSIAEFQKGLESLDDYEEIFVSNISLQNDYYNFSLNITLGSVDNGEIGEEETEN